MRNALLIASMLLSGCSVLHASALKTGHLIVTLTDKETGGPITNATVTVRSCIVSSMGPTLDSHYRNTSAQANSNGIADVEFEFQSNMFDWWVSSPTHHCAGSRSPYEHFNAVVVPSAYTHINTNTVEGLAKYNELKALHEKWQRSVLWTLANHPRVPQYVRADVSKWGLCKDEFVENGGWPTQLYVREARRMVGEYVMTEANCRGKRVAGRPVAYAAYTMDSHHVRRYVDKNGMVRNEGDVQERAGMKVPYPIDYGAIVPKRGECSNLLVPVCISATHIAYGSIRMEPVFFALGQAAGAAAAVSSRDGLDVQDVEVTAEALQ